VLRELFEALENDPFVIAECLARPLLTERLLNDHYEMVDRGRGHRTEIGLKEASPVKTEDKLPDTVTVPNSGYSLPTIADGANGCADDIWTAHPLAPFKRAEHTAVWPGIEVVVSDGSGDAVEPATGGRYNPSTDSWTATSTTNVPHARWTHTAVWTGTEMIVWGGFNDDPPFITVFNDGGKYNP